MITMQNPLEEYKKAIKLKYEEEKKGLYSSFFINPSRAKLRKLCVDRMKNNENSDDFSSFSIFFGFDFDKGNLNRLKSQTDKFRPIETFLIGKTDLSDIEGINIAALLVDFTTRPFNRYKQSGKVINSSAINFSPVGEKNKVLDNNLILRELINSKEKAKNSNITTKMFFSFMLLLFVLVIFFNIKSIAFSSKECMQWKKDHYEEVDCFNDKLGIGQFGLIVPADEHIMKLEKLNSKTALVFFNNDKPIIWYYKKDGEIELFNQPGFYPETAKPLKPITNYIIQKYRLRHKE